MWTSIGKSKSCLQEKRSCRCKRLGKVSTRLGYESTSLSVLDVHNRNSSDDKSVTNWFVWQWKLLVLHKYIWYLYISQLFFFQSTTSNDLYCCCVDIIRIWQRLTIAFFFPFFQHCLYQGNNRIVAEMQNSIFRWYFRCCQHHPCRLLLLQCWIIGKPCKLNLFLLPFHRMFRIYNDDHNSTLNFDEFKTGLEDYGCNLTDEVWRWWW